MADRNSEVILLMSCSPEVGPLDHLRVKDLRASKVLHCEGREVLAYRAMQE